MLLLLRFLFLHPRVQKSDEAASCFTGARASKLLFCSSSFFVPPLSNLLSNRPSEIKLLLGPEKPACGSYFSPRLEKKYVCVFHCRWNLSVFHCLPPPAPDDDDRKNQLLRMR